jgi:hypothetical protein
MFFSKKQKSFATDIWFKNQEFKVTIIPKAEDQFDVEISNFKGSLCGDDWVALRHYLKEEGFLEEAQNFCK